MNKLCFSRYAFSRCVAAALLAAGGSQPPIRAPGAMPQTSAIAAHPERDKSWMRSRTSRGDLIYVAAAGKSYVLTYPQGKLVGTIDYGAADACSDSAGNVFLTVDQGVDEFSHGATSPSATLSVPGTSWGCAHADIVTTLRTYAMATDRLMSEAAGKLDSAIMTAMQKAPIAS